MTTSHYYTFEGYSPLDGLDETRGRWMLDDQKRIQVWVETEEVA